GRLRRRPYRIYISRQEYFDEISQYYGEVSEGEKVCLFGSNGFLEIAINKGNGSGLLGIKIGKTVLVEFL
ncbi:MAG: SAM hydroxide adenosyltransferase, partial [Bacteroidia bacterium]